MAKIQVKFPRTVNDSIREYLAILQDCEILHAEAFGNVQAEQLRCFEKNNGCQACGGRGWVVVWDTSDSLSGQFAEYGDCPNKDCTKETRTKSGLKPYYNKYDGLRGVLDPRKNGLLYHMLCGNIDVQINELKSKISELMLNCLFEKGMKVLVVKGRKLPIGSVKHIAFCTADSLLLKDADNWMDKSAPGIWVSNANVEVLDGQSTFWINKNF